MKLHEVARQAPLIAKLLKKLVEKGAVVRARVEISSISMDPTPDRGDALVIRVDDTLKFFLIRDLIDVSGTMANLRVDFEDDDDTDLVLKKDEATGEYLLRDRNPRKYISV